MEILSVAVATSVWGAVPALVGGLALLLAFMGLMAGEGKAVLVAAAVVVLAYCGRGWVSSHVDAPREQASAAAAIEQFQPYRGQLSETRFPLKELAQKDLLHGEIRGSVTGAFFLVIGGVSGSIYGQVDETQQLTIIYFDDDTLIDAKSGVWRVMTFPLEKAEIVSIPAGAKPYLKYGSEIKVFDNFDIRRVVLVAADVPTLYLPEGWQLIGANENYGR